MNSLELFWSIPPEDVYDRLETTPQGLSETEATLRLQRYGLNELAEPVRRPLWLRFADQMTHFMALLLWVAGTLAFISHTPELGWAIWAVIWINAIFSFGQEFRAEKALLLRAYCFLGLIEASLGMTGFFLVWGSHGYNLADLQSVTPSILNHTANATLMMIYAQATTMTLAVIVACQDGTLFSCRSEHTSAFKLGWFSNRLIWIGIFTEWSLLLSLIYFYPFQKIFTTAPLMGWQFALLFLCPPLLLGAEELRKFAFMNWGPIRQKGNC